MVPFILGDTVKLKAWAFPSGISRHSQVREFNLISQERVTMKYELVSGIADHRISSEPLQLSTARSSSICSPGLGAGASQDSLREDCLLCHVAGAQQRIKMERAQFTHPSETRRPRPPRRPPPCRTPRAPSTVPAI
ncbi:hypothetical protein THAOC_05151 [Thalassiosira oceanica]|uniref:Uncharacterized protein n=1 Tax=Thalassiosira oceanica TaxID=159749 RepID=K0THT0_THAOC|nr:hypothetical protein THAOC_05151 [Thalassiosira oceanica]|eukprot:EJK73236.1 hypothetical protein THAOC_05151 [Thalassiosira oceanica]